MCSRLFGLFNKFYDKVVYLVVVYFIINGVYL